MRCIPGLKSFNLIDFMKSGLVRGGSGEVRGRFGGGLGMVGQGRENVWVFFGRPDGFGSSDFAQIVDLFMLYRSIWVLGD